MDRDLQLLINAESLVPPLTGIGLYTRHLLEEYARFMLPGALHCFAGNRLAEPGECLSRIDNQAPQAVRARERRLSLLHRLADRTSLPYRLYQHRNRRAFRHAVRGLPSGTVYHEPNYVLKPFAGPAVPTIHDLSVFHYPQFHPKSRVRHLETHLPATLERAAHVITDSDLVRIELIDQFGLAPSRVSAIHLGVADRFAPVEGRELREVLARHRLEADGYILSVSTFEPRKNLAGLVEAFRALPRTLRQRFPLVLAGGRGWLSGDMAARLQRLQDRGEVRRLGYVPRDDLPALYSGARVFAFPSLYEGFGLPVLEAMACCTPVVTTRGTSMVEITGDAAELVPAGNTDALAKALQALLEDGEHCQRLGLAGRERSAQFTWNRCAELHLEVFRQVAMNSQSGRGL